jgi:hypothetical protein
MNDYKVKVKGKSFAYSTNIKLAGEVILQLGIKQTEA